LHRTHALALDRLQLPAWHSRHVLAEKLENVPASHAVQVLPWLELM